MEEIYHYDANKMSLAGLERVLMGTIYGETNSYLKITLFRGLNVEENMSDKELKIIYPGLAFGMPQYVLFGSLTIEDPEVKPADFVINDASSDDSELTLNLKNESELTFLTHSEKRFKLKAREIEFCEANPQEFLQDSYYAIL